MQSCLHLAIMLLCGLLVGEIARFFRVPLVTGYLLAGIIIGPHALGWITKENVHDLNIISAVALNVIMFMVGTEFESSHFRRGVKRILAIAGCEAGITFLLVGIATTTACVLTPTALGRTDAVRLGVLLGALAIATAPAATLLVLKEYDSEGPVTEHILALVALNNLVCVILFHTIFSLVCSPQDQGIRAAFLRLATQVFGSIAAGIAIGLVVSYVDRKVVGREQIVVTVGGILFVIGLCNILPLSPMLTSLAFGVVFVNAALDPRKVTDEIYRMALPLYVAFFALHGADLHLGALGTAGVIAVSYILVRCLAKWVGINIGCRLAASPHAVKRFLGIGMLCPAEAGIGLAGIAAAGGGAIGELTKTIILGAVVIFEMIGPILVKLSVVKAGEVKLVSLLHRERGAYEGSDIVAVISDLLSAMGYHAWKRSQASDLRVKHVMRRSVQPILETAHFDEVVRFVDHSRYSHFPVVDEEGRFKGVLSFDELRDVLFAQNVSNLVLASDLAHENVPLLSPEDTLQHALSKFHECGFACLPVVDPNDPGKLLGLLEQRAVLRVYHEQRQSGA